MALDRGGVITEVRKIVEAPMTYAGLKEKAESFLGAVDTAEEKTSFHALLEEIKSDVLTIDQLISFTGSPDGAALLGAQKAGEYHVAAKKAKEQGETTCICPACQACKAVLENQAAIAS